MFYSAGTEASWSGLSAAMSTFCVTTMGTYTETYNNGLSMDNASTNVLCAAVVRSPCARSSGI